MARIDNLTNFLTDVADSIRDKKGTTDVIKASDFDTEISSIETGGGTDFEITDARYLFAGGARMDIADILIPKIAKSCQNYLYMFYSCSSYTDLSEYLSQLDTSNATNMYGMFSSCTSLTTIPQLDTSNATKMNSMFSGCTSLTTIPQLDTSNATDMNNMFFNCSKLEAVPRLSTSNVTNMNSMFSICASLTTIPQLDTSNVTNMYQMFYGCSNLTTLGGFKDLGKAYSTSQSANYSSYTLTLSYANNLTEESLMNVINNLYDIATAGCKTQTLTLGSTNKAKLTAAQIAIATNKGWTVS